MEWSAEALNLFNVAVFAAIGARAARSALGEPSPPLRTLHWVVVLAAAAFFLSAGHHTLIHADRLGLLGATGLLGGGSAPVLPTGWRLLKSATTLALGIVAMHLLRTLGGDVRRLQDLLALLADGVPTSTSLQDCRLTPREWDVLHVMRTGGLSDHDIAASLHISPSTAKTHVRNILGKTGVRSRRGLVLMVLRSHQPGDRPPAARRVRRQRHESASSRSP